MTIHIHDELISLLGGAPRLDWEAEFDGSPYGHTIGKKGRNGKTIEAPHQPSPQATEFADALLELIAAKVQLQAEENRETYGYHDTARHQDAYGKAVTRLWNAVGGR